MTDITLVGEFRPATFSAAWLKSRGLVRSSDVDESDSNVSEEKFRNDFYQLHGPAFTLVVTRDRLTVQGQSNNGPLVRDLALGLLQVNIATAVSDLGLNFQAHYKCDSKEQWHAVGHHLAPKETWHELFPEQHVGMRSLTMRIASSDATDITDWVELTIQPSVQVHPGVFFAWNDHHGKIHQEGDAEDSVADAMAIIRDNYDRLLIESYKKFAETLAYANK